MHLTQYSIAKTSIKGRKQYLYMKSWRDINLPTDHSRVGCMDEMFPNRCMVTPNEVEEMSVWTGYNKEQWCSRDCQLRDRDLVKISRRDRDRDFIKNSETETRDFKICVFCGHFSKKFRHHFWPWASAGGKRTFPPLRSKLSVKFF